ncbi:dimethylsulfonioproprionate lyase 7-like isoform X2 [Acropora millepora]|uniref:dimethylsulfonioproprionate lyase 7-like isoform X2 n=1 Tax=Acropora millepora TaxID=45264 RepID=UPI0010FC978F|nr:dimethylsulfonioproprionate lyase 7-like isoform X2 [Acropora millepora]
MLHRGSLFLSLSRFSKVRRIPQKKMSAETKKSAAPRLGVIRLDYKYEAALGDIDHLDSFNFHVYYKVVPGLTFEVCQEGKMSDEVKDRFKESIKWLVREKKVNGITGDCGFMMNFQDFARKITKIPIFMSSLCQLPAVTCSYEEKEQIIIMTANGKNLEPMRDLIRDECGVDTQDKRYNIVGCEDVPYFGQAVANGDKVNIEEATPWIVRKAVHALFKYPKSRAFLLECTELPAYSDSIRFYTGLPVYDSVTACQFFINGHTDNVRFGLQNWQDEWDGNQEEYQYGDNLTKEEQNQLVHKVE